MGDISKDVLWRYLPFDQFERIDDIEIKKNYIKKRNDIVKYIINPLYMYALRNGFNDKNFIQANTINEMVVELSKFYNRRGYGREDLTDIIKGSTKKK